MALRQGHHQVKHLAEKIATLQQRRDEYAAIQAELERTGESQVSLTDPDSRAMATYPKVGVGYNAQVAVDAKHKLIVEQEVTNLGSDLGQLASTAIPAKEALGVETIQATADRGYYKGEDIAACEAAGITAFVPKPLGRGAAASNGRFPKEAFIYDAAADVYRCPNGETLSPHSESTTRGHRLNQGHFLLKGLRQVRAEFSLSTLAYNLLRAINIVGVKALVEALRRRLRALARASRRAHDSKGGFYARVFTLIARREQNFVAAGLPA